MKIDATYCHAISPGDIPSAEASCPRAVLVALDRDSEHTKLVLSALHERLPRVPIGLVISEAGRDVALQWLRERRVDRLIPKNQFETARRTCCGPPLPWCAATSLYEQLEPDCYCCNGRHRPWAAISCYLPGAERRVIAVTATAHTGPCVRLLDCIPIELMHRRRCVSRLGWRERRARLKRRSTRSALRFTKFEKYFARDFPRESGGTINVLVLRGLPPAAFTT